MVSDPRSIANLMLDEADRCGHRITNLALQKLLYFAHAIFLIEEKRPLVSGYFEAWEYGPVNPTAYQAFKSAGTQPITFRATRVEVATGVRADITPPDDLVSPTARRADNAVLRPNDAWPVGRHLPRQGGALGLHRKQRENIASIWLANLR